MSKSILHRACRVLLGITFIASVLLPAGIVKAEEGAPNTIWVAADAAWEYYSQADEPAAEWLQPGQPLEGWSSGQAPLGYGEDDLVTTLSFGDDPENKYPAAYFRRSFTVESESGPAGLQIRLKVDDGAVVYLNGAEAYRSENLKEGSSLPFTDRNACAETEELINLDQNLLVPGENLIAVEVRNCTAFSSDLVFQAELRSPAEDDLEPGLAPPPAEPTQPETPEAGPAPLIDGSQPLADPASEPTTGPTDPAAPAAGPDASPTADPAALALVDPNAVPAGEGIAVEPGNNATNPYGGAGTKIWTPMIARARPGIVAGPNMPTGGRQYFVSTKGSSSNDGSESRPWSLSSALQKSSVRPGDIIWVRGGKYGSGGDTNFNVKLNGSDSRPVVVRNYPGERATVNGGLTVYGDNTWFWGLEITNTSTARKVDPSDRKPGFTIVGPGTRVINCVVNNTGHPGIGYWEERDEDGSEYGEVYGNLIWGAGVYDATTKSDNDSWIRGSAMYLQNRHGKILVSDNVTFRNFTTGMKAYAEDEAYVNGYQFHNNIVFANPNRNIFASGSSYPFRGLQMIGNMTWRSLGDADWGMVAGHASSDQYDAVIKDNYLVNGPFEVGALFTKNIRDLTVSGNTIVSAGPLVTYERASNVGSQSWNNNRYYDAGNDFSPFYREGSGASFSSWKSATGFDSNSSYSSGKPSSNAVFVKPNKYEPGRANIAIYNWEGRSSMAVDISSAVRPGQRFRIVDAQNFYGPSIVSGVYQGGTVTLPLNLTAVSSIVGTVTHIRNVHTSSQFNSFIILPE